VISQNIEWKNGEQSKTIIFRQKKKQQNKKQNKTKNNNNNNNNKKTNRVQSSLFRVNVYEGHSWNKIRYKQRNF